MILTRNFDFAGGQVFDRLVRAAVAEVHFRGFATEGKGQELVAEADAGDRFAGFQEITE